MHYVDHEAQKITITVQITHNLNDPRMSHACDTRVARVWHTYCKDKKTRGIAPRMYTCVASNTRV